MARDVLGQPRPVRREVHVLLADRDDAARGEPRRQQVEGRPRRDQDAAVEGPQPPEQRDVRPQAAERIDVVLRVDEQARQAVEQGPALGQRPRGGQREEGPLATADEADHLDVAALREVAGDVERRADGAAHAPGMREQHADRTGRSRGAAARQPGRESERAAVRGHRERPEQAASRRLSRHGGHAKALARTWSASKPHRLGGTLAATVKRDQLPPHKTATYVMPRWEAVYVSVNKAACTSLKWLVAELQGEDPEHFHRSLSREISRTMTIHRRSLWRKTPMAKRLSDERLEEISPERGWFVFAVVRHPTARLFSAWQSKLLLREPWWVEQFGGEEWFPRVPEHGDDIVDEFVRFARLIARDPEQTIMRNRHFAPQGWMLAADRMPYTRIYRTSEIGELLEDFEKHLRAHGYDGGPLELLRANETPLKPIASLFPPDVLDISRALYARRLRALRLRRRDAGRAGPVRSLRRRGAAGDHPADRARRAHQRPRAAGSRDQGRGGRRRRRAAAIVLAGAPHRLARQAPARQRLSARARRTARRIGLRRRSGSRVQAASAARRGALGFGGRLSSVSAASVRIPTLRGS